MEDNVLFRLAHWYGFLKYMKTVIVFTKIVYAKKV